ncbi:MAG: hypothetical protein Q7S03_00020, partial [bacterium]|nr:hypothetical protein [bacterium]
NAIQLLLSVGLIVFLTLIIGIQSTAFTGFPKGYDSFYHLGFARIISENFPNILWNPYWNGGVDLLYRNYPPLYHFSLGLLNRFLGLDLVMLVKATAIINVAVTAISLFLTVYVLTRRTLYGLFSGLFFLASSTLWCQIVQDGIYARLFAMMLVGLSLLSMTLWHVEKKTKYLWLLVFSLSLAFLSHFLSGFLASFAFLVILLFRSLSLKEKILAIGKVFLPVLGLISFYYLPLMLLRAGQLGLVGDFQEARKYEPLVLLSLFRQGYPGLPFLSLPLAFLVLILVFLMRYKIDRKNRILLEFFSALAVLSLFCIGYSVGLLHKFFYGVSTTQMLLPAAMFLSLFLGLGIFFLSTLEVLRKSVFLIVLVGLTAMTLAQMPKLKSLSLDQANYFPKGSFRELPEGKSFRFAGLEDVVGESFNYYTSIPQTGGYFEPGVIYPQYYWWFIYGVYNTSGNLPETKFLLDWYAVNNVYYNSRTLGRERDKAQASRKIFQDVDFIASPKGIVEYQKAGPIVLASNAPVFLTQKEGKAYEDVLHLLAKEDLDSRFVIPIEGKRLKAKEFSAKIIRSIEEASTSASLSVNDSTEGSQDDQEADFVNSQKRQIVLRDNFAGVIFKESYTGRWRAYLLGARGEGLGARTDLKIYKAGMGMMYAPLPASYSLPAEVIFEYQWGGIEKGSLVISLLTLTFIILQIFRVNLFEKANNFQFIIFNLKSNPKFKIFKRKN